MFKGRQLFIATMHKKESMIAPLLENDLGVVCFTSDAIDTDSLGTFSGEISRKDSVLVTLRNKCILGSVVADCDLVIASEGSFGAHPSIFFAHADEEVIMIKDFTTDIEIVASVISLETNFDAQEIETEVELLQFANKVKFPSHGIILKPAEKDYSTVIKGITDKEILLAHFRELRKDCKTVYAETDMRAMFNPTRMKVIAEATQKLLEKIASVCPACQHPGFDIVSATPGLPCSICSFPTRSTLSHVYQCKKCDHKEIKMFPRMIQNEDPTFCDRCNP